VRLAPDFAGSVPSNRVKQGIVQTEIGVFRSVGFKNGGFFLRCFAKIVLYSGSASEF
jgi:hypothetical protein